MKFVPTEVEGAWVVEPEPRDDERGSFARTWCRSEFAARGLDIRMEQCSVSFNRRAATLRGMHLQVAPFEETKLVRCTAGALFDVVLDLRPRSPTYLRYAAAELTAANRVAMYVPAGCAHGFVTLLPETEVFYQISTAYEAAAQRGWRWNDPAFSIRWPVVPEIMSERDRTYPDYSR